MRTPSQTVGPFFAIGLTKATQNELPGEAGVRIDGQVFDGAGAPISDALLELWDPGHGFGRCATDAEGRFWFFVPPAAERFELMVFARGLLKPAVTRLYLASSGAEDHTMVATPAGDGYRFDVRLQGDDATGFWRT